ncbi:MAG TPA: hypothetical protein VIP53_03115 [Nitrososphaera sp.]
MCWTIKDTAPVAQDARETEEAAEEAKPVHTEPPQQMPRSSVKVGHDNRIIEGGGAAPQIGSKLPLPTDIPPSTIKKEVKKEPVKTTEKEEYQQRLSSTKSWKWIAIAGRALGVILISMLGTGHLSITPSSPDTPTTTPESDPIRQPLLLPEVQQSKGNQQRYSFVRAWGSKGTGQGQFSYLWSVAVGSQGHVYVADPGNDRVQKFGSDGGCITSWGSPGNGMWFPRGIAVGSQGHVYVADSGNDRVQKFGSDGGYITSWGSKGTGQGQFNGPLGIAVDSQGDVYVADTGNDRVQKFDSTGQFTTSWGSKGTGQGQFDRPLGIAVGSQGHVYVADNSNHRVQVWAPDTSISSDSQQGP